MATSATTYLSTARAEIQNLGDSSVSFGPGITKAYFLWARDNGVAPTAEELANWMYMYGQPSSTWPGFIHQYLAKSQSELLIEAPMNDTERAIAAAYGLGATGKAYPAVYGLELGGGGTGVGGSRGMEFNFDAGDVVNVASTLLAGDCVKALREGRYLDYLKCVMPGGSTGTNAQGQQNRDPVKEMGRDVGNILLPGQPFGQGPGETVTGAFGIPARKPRVRQLNIRQCGPGFVLGKDGNCYVKGTIPRKFRAWRPGRKPPVTAGDAKAIARAARTKDRVKGLAKAVGLKTSSTARRPGGRKRR